MACNIGVPGYPKDATILATTHWYGCAITGSDPTSTCCTPSRQMGHYHAPSIQHCARPLSSFIIQAHASRPEQTLIQELS